MNKKCLLSSSESLRRGLALVLRQGRSTKGRPGIAGTGDAFVFDDARNFIGDSHMLQSNLANAGELQADYISIGGRTLAFDQIFNEAFFTPSKIKELRKTYNHNAPYPHLVFEGLFSPIFLELMYSEFDSIKWKRLEALRQYK